MAENGNGPQPESQKKRSLKARTGRNVFYLNVAVGQLNAFVVFLLRYVA